MMREVIMEGEDWPEYVKVGKVFVFAKGGGTTAKVENTRTLVATSHMTKVIELGIVKNLEEACRVAPDYLEGSNLPPLLQINEKY